MSADERARGARASAAAAPEREAAQGGTARTAPSVALERRATSAPRDLRPVGPAEPSAASLAALQAATDAGDLPALRALVERDRSLVRYEALRRLLELTGPEGLGELTALLERDPDVALQATLGEAFAAGGRAADAEALGDLIARAPSPSSRLFAAAAVLEIGAREPLAPRARDEALLALEALAGDARWDEDACGALTLAGAAGVPALERISGDRGLAAAVRLAAAEALTELDPTRALARLQELAAEDRGPVGRLARNRLEAR